MSCNVMTLGTILAMPIAPTASSYYPFVVNRTVKIWSVVSASVVEFAETLFTCYCLHAIFCVESHRAGQLFFYMAFACCVNVYMVSVHTSST